MGGEGRDIREERVESLAKGLRLIDEERRRGSEVRPAAEASRCMRQRPTDSLQGGVGAKPSAVAHPRIDASQPLRHHRDVTIEKSEAVPEEAFERLGDMLVPGNGKEVVEENIGDDPRVMPEAGGDDAPELPDRGMGVGERIDPAVHDDAGAHFRRESIAERTMNEVAGQIADQKLRPGAAEQEVCEMIHAPAVWHEARPGKQAGGPTFRRPAVLRFIPRVRLKRYPDIPLSG
jgi:hypothetical protein